MALTNSYENCRLWPGKPTRNILQHNNAAILAYSGDAEFAAVENEGVDLAAPY